MHFWLLWGFFVFFFKFIGLTLIKKNCVRIGSLNKQTNDRDVLVQLSVLKYIKKH